MTKFRVIGLAAAVLVLSGCAGQIGDGDPVALPSTSAVDGRATGTQTARPTISASETPAPAVTEKPTTRPTLDELDLTSEGLGYLRIGQPVPEHDATTAIVSWTIDPCSTGTKDGSLAGWDTPYGTHRDGGIPFLVESKSKSSAVMSILIVSEAIHTRHGLHIGSSVEEVTALGGVKEKPAGQAFPGFAVPWVIHGSAGELVFWPATSAGQSVAKGIVGQINLQKEGTAPTFHYAWGCD